MSDTSIGSEVKAALSIDTDALEQVHARLVSQKDKTQNRQQVINEAREWAKGENPQVEDLLAILARDPDEVL